MGVYTVYNIGCIYRIYNIYILYIYIIYYSCFLLAKGLFRVSWEQVQVCQNGVTHGMMKLIGVEGFAGD